jgi:uncharacterized membrane protein HdeD (DUF308 family)
MAIDVDVVPEHWRAFVLRGIAGVIFGILTLLMPGMALLTLVFLFGGYAIVEGVLNVVAALRRTEPRERPAWVLLLWGSVSVLAGLIAFFMPGLTALSLLTVIAAWSIVTGVLEIVAAVRLRRQIEREWLLALSGGLSVAFGVLLVVFPGAGALTVLLWIGAYAIVFGALLIALGVKLRNRARAERPRTGAGELAPSPSR